MINNGSNNWNVGYSYICWFERLLRTHRNVVNLSRHTDLVFEVDRKRQRDHLIIFCCNEYTMGLTMVQRALYEFGNLNLIHTGGNWNGYTRQAKEFCLDAKIGLYISDEMSGALWQDEFSSYHQKDKDGNPTDHIRT